MGKDLKGKELGKGICQEKNGYYMARLTTRNGQRKAKRFKKLAECRQWIADASFSYENSDLAHLADINVDGWFQYWCSVKEKTVKKSTYRLYYRRYEQNIKNEIGRCKLVDIKPIHCQEVLNKMADQGYKSTTIKSTRIVLHNMFEFAYENDIILKNPCKKSIKSNIGAASTPKEALTLSEQQQFIEQGGYLEYFNHFCFILQTGLRVGELIGLEWDDVNFDDRIITIQRTSSYQTDIGGWETTVPKTEAGIRTVPLTQEALEILVQQKAKLWNLKIIPLEWRNRIFLNKFGNPISCTNYDNSLRLFCQRNGMKPFSVHILRHTFATRCVEAGMKPKTLQKILGHSNISVTMDLYVHITEDEKQREINKVENVLRMVQ